MVCKLLILATISTTGLGRFFTMPEWMPTNVAPAYIAYGTAQAPSTEHQAPSTNVVYIRFSTNNAAAVASAFDGMFERYYLGEFGMQSEGTIDEMHVSTNPQPRSVTRRLFEVPPSKWKYFLFDWGERTPYRNEWNSIESYDWKRVYTNSLRLAHFDDQHVTRAWLDGRGHKIDAPGHKTNSVAATWGGENLSKAQGDPGWVTFEREEMAPTNGAVRFADLVNMLPVYGGLEPDDLFYSKADERNAASRNAIRVWPDVWKTIRSYDVNSGDYNQTISDLFGTGPNSYRRVWHTNRLESVLAESLGLDLARLSLTNHWTNETMRFDTKLVGTMNTMIADLDRRYDVAPGDELLEVHCADYECANEITVPTYIGDDVLLLNNASISNIPILVSESGATVANGTVYERHDADSLLQYDSAGGTNRYPSYLSGYTPLLSYPRIRFSGVTASTGGGVHFTINMHGPTLSMIREVVRQLAGVMALLGVGNERTTFWMQFGRARQSAVISCRPVAYKIGGPTDPGTWNQIGGYVPSFSMDYSMFSITPLDWRVITLAASCHKTYNCDSTVDERTKVIDRIPKPEEELGAWPVSNVWRGATGDVLERVKPHVGHTVVAIDYDARRETDDGVVRHSTRGSHTNVIERFSAFNAVITESSSIDMPYTRWGIMDRGNQDVDSIRCFYYHLNGFNLMDRRWVEINQPGGAGTFLNPKDHELVHIICTNCVEQLTSNPVSTDDGNTFWRSVGDGGGIGPAATPPGSFCLTIFSVVRDTNGNLVDVDYTVNKFDGGTIGINTSEDHACASSAQKNGKTYDHDLIHYDLIEIFGYVPLYSEYQADPPVSIDCRQATLVEKNFIFHNLKRENDNDDE